MRGRQQGASAADVETARQMALTAAVAIKVREDAGAAAAALHGLAKGLRILASGGIDPVQSAFAAIAVDPGDSGTIECPVCKGQMAWAQDSHNGHLHGQCETDGCLRWMQ